MTSPKLSCRREDFESLLKSHMGSVVDILEKGTDGLIPAMAVLALQPPKWTDSAITVVCIAGDFNDHDTKYGAMHTIGKSLYDSHQIPLAVVMASEAWMVAYDHEPDPKNIKINLQPRDDPRRTEIVGIQGIGILETGKLTVFTNMQICRDENNQIIPGVFEEPIYSDAESKTEANLLDEFFRGYARQLAKRHNHANTN